VKKEASFDVHCSGDISGMLGAAMVECRGGFVVCKQECVQEQK